jgi:hypothetical protein
MIWNKEGSLIYIALAFGLHKFRMEEGKEIPRAEALVLNRYVH